MSRLHVKITVLMPSLLLMAMVSLHSVSANVLKDPMRPSHVPDTSSSAITRAVERKKQPKPEKKLLLNAITYTDDAMSRSAIINGIWVKQGSRINGAKVTRIGTGTVELTRDGKVVVVRLVPQIKFTPES